MAIYFLGKYGQKEKARFGNDYDVYGIQTDSDLKTYKFGFEFTSVWCLKRLSKIIWGR